MCGISVQVAFKLLVLDRVLEEDSVTGDAYGPYDADLVERERKRLRVEKVRPGALLRALMWTCQLLSMCTKGCQVSNFKLPRPAQSPRSTVSRCGVGVLLHAVCKAMGVIGPRVCAV